jgi:ABC-type Fe2+-enterobactin transport system substrate-binding protein
MRGVHYVRNETGKDSSGVIAQELQKIAPELVLTAEDEMGTLSVNYGNITGYLIEAIKELKAEIEELKAR